MKKNNSGFTLIELLAVIVILAVLVLLAMPRVMDMMEKSKKNAFKVEVQEILKYVDMAYADQSMSGKMKSITTTVDGNNNVPTRYLCMSIDDMSEYMSKDFDSSGYTGFIEIFIPSKGDILYGVNVSNGSYSYFIATSSKLSKDNAIDGMGTEVEITGKCNTDGKTPVYAYNTYKKDGFTP